MPNWNVPNTLAPSQPQPQGQQPQQWAQQPQQQAIPAPMNRPAGAVTPRMNTAYGAFKARPAPQAPAMPQMPTSQSPVAQTPVGYGVPGNPTRQRGF